MPTKTRSGQRQQKQEADHIMDHAAAAMWRGAAEGRPSLCGPLPVFLALIILCFLGIGPYCFFGIGPYYIFGIGHLLFLSTATIFSFPVLLLSSWF